MRVCRQPLAKLYHREVFNSSSQENFKQVPDCPSLIVIELVEEVFSFKVMGVGEDRSDYLKSLETAELSWLMHFSCNA